MLMAVLAPSLVKTSSERHEIQTACLEMIEETLQQERSSIQGRVSASEQKAEDFKSIQVAKDAQRAAAGTALAEKQEQEQKQKSSLAEAGEARRTAEKALADAQVAKTEGHTKLEASSKEKELLEMALQEHYIIPMDASEGPHYTALKPLLCKLILEDSLVSALPSSCAKPKDQRGSFDVLVLEELRTAFSKKIAELGYVLEAEVPAAEERASKAREAESELEKTKVIEHELTAALEAAQKDVQAAQEEAVNAVMVATGAAADVEAAVLVATAVKGELSEFEAGPLAAFLALKSPPEVFMENAESEVAAAAGA